MDGPFCIGTRTTDRSSMNAPGAGHAVSPLGVQAGQSFPGDAAVSRSCYPAQRRCRDCAAPINQAAPSRLTIASQPEGTLKLR